MGVKLTLTTVNGAQQDIYPALVVGYDVSQASRNQFHQLIDGPVGVTLYPAALRSGTLHLLFADAVAADAARSAHAAAGFWVLTDDALPQENMRYAVDGTPRKYQSDARTTWLLDIPYQEIS